MAPAGANRREETMFACSHKPRRTQGGGQSYARCAAVTLMAWPAPRPRGHEIARRILLAQQPLPERRLRRRRGGQQAVDEAGRRIGDPRPAREGAIVQPEGIPAENGLNHLAREGLAMGQGAGQHEIHIGLNDGMSGIGFGPAGAGLRHIHEKRPRLRRPHPGQRLDQSAGYRHAVISRFPAIELGQGGVVDGKHHAIDAFGRRIGGAGLQPQGGEALPASRFHTAASRNRPRPAPAAPPAAPRRCPRANRRR